MEGEGGTRREGEERRQYFRIDDVLPLIATRVESNLPFLRSRILSSIHWDTEVPVMHGERPDEGLDPNLWRMLLDINAKLNLILDKLFHDGEGVKKAEPRKVNLCAGGIRIILKDPFDVGDMIELKLFLSLHPPAWIVVYGKVIRVEPLADGSRDIAVHFLDLTDEVSSLLDRYILRRQREMIRKQRDHEA